MAIPSLLAVWRICMDFFLVILAALEGGGEADTLAASSAIRDFMSTLKEYNFSLFRNNQYIDPTYRGTECGFQTPILPALGTDGMDTSVGRPSGSIMKMSSPDGGRRIIRRGAATGKTPPIDSIEVASVTVPEASDNLDLLLVILTPHPCNGRLSRIIGSGISCNASHSACFSIAASTNIVVRDIGDFSACLRRANAASCLTNLCGKSSSIRCSSSVSRLAIMYICSRSMSCLAL